jgi:hypothetical protein
MKYLTHINEISESRNNLKKIGVSALDENKFMRFLRDKKIIKTANIGHYLKSWDVYSAYKFIKENLNFNDKIIDFGCYGSEILPILSKAGYKNLIGVDTDVNIIKYKDKYNIQFYVNDYIKDDIDIENANMIVSISAIEHGYDPEEMFKKVSKYLVQGGYFFVTFDYWPIKIDTKNIIMFDRSWDILSDQQIEAMKQIAIKYNLVVVESQQDSLKILKSPPIKWANKEYTFGQLIFKKMI